MAKTATVLRALKRGATVTRGGYVTSAGTYMTSAGKRMNAEKIRLAKGLPKPPKPASGPGSGETRTKTSAPSGTGPAKQEAIAKLKKIKAPTAKEKQIAAEEGVDMSVVDRAKVTLAKLTGSTTAKVTGALTASCGATAAAVKKYAPGSPDISDMSAEEMGRYLDGNTEAIYAAQQGGAGEDAARVQRYSHSVAATVEDVGKLTLEAEALAQEYKIKQAELKAVKARRAIGN